MKAVLVDFDGVIIDSEWPIYQSWLRVFQREGHDLKVENYVQCIGSDFEVWSPEKLLEQLTGKTYEWTEENALRQVEIERDLVGVKTLEGIRPLLDWLKEEGVACAVVSSSTHRWVDMWLETLGLLPYFDDIVCRGDAPRIKPAPDLYLEGAKRLNLPADQCIVLEDSLNGVKAGIEAGCHVIAVPSRLTCCLDFGVANEQFETISEAVTFIESVIDLKEVV